MQARVRRHVIAALAVFSIGVSAPSAQQEQIADPDFKPSIAAPTYTGTNRPIVLVDEAHANFHTVSGRYKPFADLLSADGYRVMAGTQPFTATSLHAARVVVIANALGSGINASNMNNPPSAFTDAECDAMRDWVAGGGSLFLIADHSPFGATAASLASRFGVEMGKGYAWDGSNRKDPTTNITHTRATGALGDHPIMRGVNTVVAFTGQSLSVPAGAAVLLKLGPATYESDAATGAADMTAYQSGNPTGARSVAGRAQGLAIEFGKGRVVMTAEAAMFSAQVMRLTENGKTSETKMGMNVPGNDNQQFLLNIMRWLTRYLP
jgi:hypothetical protein